MSADGSTIGDRLRRIRRERGMTQEELADASGISRDLVSMLERGTRGSARLSTVAALANGLDCEVSEIVDRRDHLGRDRDGGSVLAIRDALISPSVLPGIDEAYDDGEPTPLDKLQRRVDAAWGRYWRGDFGGLTAVLPGLIGEARITHRAAGAACVEPLALTYGLASSLMTQIGRTDLGAVAAERAITVAHGGYDELLWATMHAGFSWVLLHQARHREAEQLAASMAARFEPTFTDGDLEIGVWGNLLMTAVAPAAALERDPGDYLRLAGAGAERVGRRVPVYRTSFAPSTVRMQGTYGYSVLRQPGRALEYARRIRPGDFQGISHGAHLMDVAQAHADAGHRRTAVTTLLEAREVSPVWFRHQRVARSVVEEIRERETRLSPSVRSLAHSLDL